jgi:hypothetical protein
MEHQMFSTLRCNVPVRVAERRLPNTRSGIERYRMVACRGMTMPGARKRHFEDPRTFGYHAAIPGGRGGFIGRRRESVAANVSAPSTANMATSKLHGGRRRGPSTEM